MIRKRSGRVALPEDPPSIEGCCRRGSLAVATLCKNGPCVCELLKKRYVSTRRQANTERMQDYGLQCRITRKFTADHYKFAPEKEQENPNEFGLAESCLCVACGGQKLSIGSSEHALESLETSCQIPLATRKVAKCICKIPSTENKERQSGTKNGIDGSTPWTCSCTNQTFTDKKDCFERECQTSQHTDYISLLRSCITETICVGKQVHHALCCDRIENDSFFGIVLVEMYLKCESIENAHSIFSSLHVHNTFSWNLMIRLYTSQGQEEEALLCYHRILAEAFLADKYTFVSLLSACINLTDFDETKRIHTYIISGLHHWDIVVRNALINAYTKCGCITDAQYVFDTMVEYDSFSWDTLIGAYAKRKLHHEIICLFFQQQHQAMLPTRITYMTIIESLANFGFTSMATCLLARIFGCEFRSNANVQAGVLYFFGKVGSKEAAWRMFCEMSDRDTFSWNVILASCPHLFHDKGVLELFGRMIGEGLLPGEETLAHIISHCKDVKTQALGKFLHACIIISPSLSRIALNNALVNMYKRCAGLKDAIRAFDWIPERNIVTWTTMVGAYLEHGQAILAIELFDEMLGEGLLPDKVMLITVLDACASLRSPARIKRFHSWIRAMEIDLDLEVSSCLASLYGKCGALKLAEKVFDSILDRNILPWTAMVSAFAEHFRPDIAIQFFQQMRQESVLPNEVTYFAVLDACAKIPALMEARRFHALVPYSGFYLLSVKTALIDMYGRCSSLQEACRVFDDITECDIVLLNAMMSACARNGHVKHALHLFDMALQKGVKPDEAVYVNILSICSHGGLLDEGQRYFSSMTCDYKIKPTIHHYSCMIELYGKAGCVCEAEEMIAKMPFTASALQWMTLLSACRREVDVQRGERAARHVMLLQPGNPIPYIELSNIYSAVRREVEAAMLLSKVKELEATSLP